MLKKTLVFIGVAIVSCVILTLIGLKSYIAGFVAIVLASIVSAIIPSSKN